MRLQISEPIYPIRFHIFLPSVILGIYFGNNFGENFSYPTFGQHGKPGELKKE